jgi:hypothetical protein
MAGRLASKNKENTNKENLLITRRRQLLGVIFVYLGRLFDDAQSVECIQRKGGNYPRCDRIRGFFNETGSAVSP